MRSAPGDPRRALTRRRRTGRCSRRRRRATSPRRSVSRWADFVAGLHGAAAIADLYAARLVESGASAALKEAVDAAVAEARTTGPYGRYPAGR